MKVDPLLQKELKRRFDKDGRAVVAVFRVKMLIHIQGVDWQENCAGLLVFYQKKNTYGFTIISAINLDINFDFQLYSNFSKYTKYIGDLRALIFLAPSDQNCKKIMLVFQSKAELSEINKIISNIYKDNSNQQETDYLDRPQVQEIAKKVPIDQNLISKDLTFKQNVEKEIKDYFAKCATKKDQKKFSGFKSYALGREEWKIDEQEEKHLRAKYESQILDRLGNLQKQARVRSSPNK